MTAPLLISVSAAHPEIQQQLPALPTGKTVTAYVVCQAGLFAGHDFDTGDVVVCRGAADDGELVVLVASGHGRPRMGTIDGRLVRGDAGEPCHPGRWAVAGRMVAVYRATVHGWVVDLLDAAPVQVRAESHEPRAQLSLFGEHGRQAA